MNRTGCTYRIATSRSRPAAIAAIDLRAETAESLDRLLSRLSIGTVDPGGVRLRRVAGIDEAVAARWSPTRATVMPHGGPAVLNAIAAAMEAAGARRCDGEPRSRYPEARGRVEALALASLARAESPLAVDLLLAQADRWSGRTPRAMTARDSRLRRLIDPPTVAVVGPANVGKSTLLNTLAGRRAAAVADEPGTTRDHVGASVDLAGLTVRWIDCPGRRSAVGPELAAQRVADSVVAAADLVLSAGDAESADPRIGMDPEPGLSVALRADLGRADWPADIAVSAATGSGCEELVGLIRERLVPKSDLDSDEPWVFCDSLIG